MQDVDNSSPEGDFGALTLLAAADAAWHFVSYRRKRLEGDDPSGLEPRRAALHRAQDLLPEITDMCVRTRLLAVLTEYPEERDVAHSRLFEALLTVRRGAEKLRILHQTLMNLFPEISPESVEAVRRASIDLSVLAEGLNSRPERPGTIVLQRVQNLIDSLRIELRALAAVNGR